MNKMTLIFLAGLTALPMLACARNMDGIVVKGLHQRGEVLVEREQGEETIVVVRETSRIVKYVVRSYKMGISSASAAEVLYSVDPTLEECYAGGASTPVECVKVARDPDLKPYMSWAEAESAAE